MGWSLYIPPGVGPPATLRPRDASLCIVTGSGKGSVLIIRADSARKRRRKSRESRVQLLQRIAEHTLKAWEQRGTGTQGGGL